MYISLFHISYENDLITNESNGFCVCYSSFGSLKAYAKFTTKL